ncbi:serine-rich adhesin for platelets-like [Hordeum vulgare]|nr:serine-rich adhesin for platelets-like [Hordeum vulgare]
MAAITAHVYHPVVALSRCGPPSNPFIRFAPSPSVLLRSRGAARPPLAPIGARGKDDDPISYPEPRNSSLGLSPLLVAVAAAATPQAALALSGGSCGGCDDSSSSSSSSSSSCDDSTTDSIDWLSTSFSSKPKKKEGAEATHVSVGTAAAPPLGWSSDLWFWGTFALGSAGVAALFFASVKLLGETTAVIKLQVALRDTAMIKSVQKDLNSIAERVEGSNGWWYKFILTETTYSLRRHQHCCISSCLSVVKTNIEGSWKKHFDRISVEERSKFDEETLSNSNGVKQKKTYSMKTDGSRNEYIVVTILVAANGTINLPEAIKSPADLEAVLARLNYMSASELRGVRVMWTPQDADDVLSEERMRKDYPYLKPLV